MKEMKFSKLKDCIELREGIAALESKLNVTEFKFGVCYFKSGQTENEMFANTKEETVPEFKELLDLLGNKIKLQSWDGFAGGLDVKTNTTGLETIHTKFSDLQVLFHVTVMLPFSKSDEQQVERKRHVGNDITVIIFHEGGRAFDPALLTSQFNHVYCVIAVDEQKKKEQKGGPTPITLEICTKEGVRPYGPTYDKDNLYLDQNFKNFIMSKLINAE
eukprot:CAMPEP_0174269650 /NCGR_PEP_ID=MMETSP0439-20130205/41765_1 /TAXON_ID=0 /ORGANISM="Stereomyxa ramosa, Strain Chinc5" /LENGTH=216 /DNA_ID=CAMNT_0015358537 /DNA_START=199 /DNA_END=846 /DNA_ORIENTATION=+